MKSRIMGALMLSAVVTSFPSQAQAEVDDWAARAAADLREAHQLMLENHPGPVDTQNPGFSDRAQAALDAALALTPRVNDFDGYAAILSAYTAHFRDGHFVLFAPAVTGGDATLNWPGFMTAWRANTVKIVDVEPGREDLRGAHILSCDGVEINALIRQNVFAFSSGKPDQIAYWARFAPQAFLDTGNPIIQRPTVCQLQLTHGEILDYTLEWHAAGNDIGARLAAARFGPRPVTGLREVAPGRFWINLPNFNPGPETIDRVRQTLQDISAHREVLQEAEAIVIDMRGNQGGSTLWGIDMIEALWGKPYRLSRRPESTTYAEWRASAANIAHMEQGLEFLLNNGREALAENYFKPILAGVKAALAAGEATYIEPSNLGQSSEDIPSVLVANPVRAPVYFLGSEPNSPC